jgi:hypothetical protein
MTFHNCPGWNTLSSNIRKFWSRQRLSMVDTFYNSYIQMDNIKIKSYCLLRETSYCITFCYQNRWRLDSETQRHNTEKYSVLVGYLLMETFVKLYVDLKWTERILYECTWITELNNILLQYSNYHTNLLLCHTIEITLYQSTISRLRFIYKYWRIQFMPRRKHATLLQISLEYY